MTKQMDRLMLVSVATLVLVILLAGYAFNLLPENLQFALIRKKDIGETQCAIGLGGSSLLGFNEEEQCILLEEVFEDCSSESKPIVKIKDENYVASNTCLLSDNKKVTLYLKI